MGNKNTITSYKKCTPYTFTPKSGSNSVKINHFPTLTEAKRPESSDSFYQYFLLEIYRIEIDSYSLAPFDSVLFW